MNLIIHEKLANHIIILFCLDETGYLAKYVRLEQCLVTGLHDSATINTARFEAIM